jgi:hypothetical protein
VHLVLLYGLQMSPSQIVASFGCVAPLHEPSRPNELMCPFTIPMRTNEPMHWLTFASPGTDAPQPLWCVPSIAYLRPMLHLMLGKAPWRVCAPKVPTCPTSATLEYQSNPKFLLLEELGEGVHTLITEYLTSSPTSSHCPWKHPQNLRSLSLCPKSCPHHN